jgi:hypothetical protein
VLEPLAPGPLTVIHKATIAIAVVGFLLYAVWEGRHFQATGDVGSALGALAGLGGAVGAVVYLRSLVRTRSTGA